VEQQEYRSRIYDRYEVLWPNQGDRFDRKEALKSGRYFRRMLRAFLPSNKDAKILDLGCGTGVVLFNIQHLGYTNLAGVDRSPEQTRIAKQACKGVVHGDAFDYLSDCEEGFDLIIALDFLEHFTKDEVLKLLRLCYAALRPQGRLVVQTVNPDSPMALSCRYTDLTHEISVTPGCLRNLLTLVGFSDYRAQERGPIPYSFFSSIRFVLWQFIRLGYWSYNLIEVGGTSYNIYTRNFIATAVKR